MQRMSIRRYQVQHVSEGVPWVEIERCGGERKLHPRIDHTHRLRRSIRFANDSKDRSEINVKKKEKKKCTHLTCKVNSEQALRPASIMSFFSKMVQHSSTDEKRKR